MPGPLAKLRKYYLAGTTALRNRWTYPADVAGLVVSYGLFVFVFSRLWTTAYVGRAELAGYDQHQLTWYFIFSELVLFSLGNSTFLTLSNDIKTGQVAYTLSRPWALPLTALSESLAGALSLLVPFALVGWVVGTASAGAWVPVSALQVGALLLALLLTLVLQFLCQFLLSMTAFWVEENAAFLWIHQKFALILGTFLPLEFFPADWRPWVEATPYGWLAYPPSRLAVAFEPGQVPFLIGGQLFWIVVVSGAVALVFTAGRRRTVQQGG
jgi:ABC-2 type transport system permease protein